jgi:hypothetical protein
VPAETKAAVMQIVAQTKERSKWPVYRTLDASGRTAQRVLRLGPAGEPHQPARHADQSPLLRSQRSVRMGQAAGGGAIRVRLGAMRTREMDWTGLKLLLEGIEGKRVRKRYIGGSAVNMHSV